MKDAVTVVLAALLLLGMFVVFLEALKAIA